MITLDNAVLGADKQRNSTYGGDNTSVTPRGGVKRPKAMSNSHYNAL